MFGCKKKPIQMSVNAAETTSSSRRGSKTGSALRRASAVLGKLFIPQSSSSQDWNQDADRQIQPNVVSKYDSGLSKILSGLYCKTLVILGLILPVTEVLANHVNPAIYQVYYIYLCSISLIYMGWMYSSLVRNRTIVNIINAYRKNADDGIVQYRSRGRLNRYGSFYLRLGAIGFGVGSMVYSGLEFGQVLELKDSAECRMWSAIASPLFRMALTIGQMQFIFLNSQNVDMCSYSVISRFGLMHMIATNLCEWLNVIVQETKHEIAHFHDTHNQSISDTETNWSSVASECRHTNVMSSLVEDSAPILYPCTIEYSLICAVIMYQMWQDVGANEANLQRSKLPPITVQKPNNSSPDSTSEILMLDCANAHKGLLAGIGLIILTAASLTVYLLSSANHNFNGREAVDIWELVLHILAFAALPSAIVKLWGSTYIKKQGVMCLDTWLIVLAQSGVSMYSLFKITAFWMADRGSLTNEFARLIQTLTQTLFIVYYWRIRTKKPDKPARQLITFLLLCNAAFWCINTLVLNRISSDIEMIDFYGRWGWTVMSRIAMPLNIFYRFHSTICLFEIWKNVYKPSTQNKTTIPLIEVSAT